MGYNAPGQLGDGTYNNTNQPEMIVASNVTAIAAGSMHSLFIKSDGSLWAMGNDSEGQLGDGTFFGGVVSGTNLPEQIAASNVMVIAAGSMHSLFVKKNGSLWAMGEERFGELGDGAYYFATNLPEQIVASAVTAVAAGEGDSLFLKNDGSLWAMGENPVGELGDGTTDGGNYQTNLPEQIVAGPPGYNRISAQLLAGGKVGLSYVGMTGTNYVLDRSFSLSAANWVPQATNPAGAGGVLVFTNTPDPAFNDFWRIHSVP
jgi:alpha-tubulin suppressor-like RCC1 family protein